MVPLIGIIPSLANKLQNKKTRENKTYNRPSIYIAKLTDKLVRYSQDLDAVYQDHTSEDGVEKDWFAMKKLSLNFLFSYVENDYHNHTLKENLFVYRLLMMAFFICFTV